MKATAKCDQQCELHNSVIERMLIFRVSLENMSWMVVFFSFRHFLFPYICLP